MSLWKYVPFISMLDSTIAICQAEKTLKLYIFDDEFYFI